MTFRLFFAAALVMVVLPLAAGSGTARAALSPSAPAPVSSAPGVSASGAPAADDIRDIHGPIAIARPTPAWWYLAGTGGAAGLIAILVLARHRRSRVLTPRERALAALESERALVEGGAREFSIAVSETIRCYVEEAFFLPASHRTTDELLSDLMRDQSPVAAHRNELAQFLSFCDLAKFAGRSFSSTDMRGMLASAEAFVRATAASPPVVTHAAALVGQGAA
jgi:hypothetical protein